MRVVPVAIEQRWMGLPGNARGAVWMIASGVGFTFMAIAIKLLGHRLDSFQIAFFRCLIGFVAILPLIGAYGLDVLQTRSLKIHALRGLFGLIAMFASYYAIGHIPLTSYTALSFTKPLFSTILAVIVLREIVRWRRWSATAVGFIGVLVMVRPGAETFNEAALFALMDAFSIAFLVTLIKRLPPGETPLGMMFYFGVFSTIAALPPALFVWQWPTTNEWALLVVIGILGALSQSFWIRAYRAGEASIVAPFDYLRLLFAGIAGYLAFAETVDLWTVLGAAIIVISTVYIARREARLPRAQAKARIAAKAAEELR